MSELKCPFLKETCLRTKCAIFVARKECAVKVIAEEFKALGKIQDQLLNYEKKKYKGY
ncbi:MAG: hypothetical protein ACFFBD_29660 [Candidatus Hodarchaeota archaeon]